MEATKNTKTEAVTTPDGQQLYAPSLATGEKLPMRYCNRCGEEIVWCKSKRTGKFYPANVFLMGSHNARKFAPWSPHKCGKS